MRLLCALLLIACAASAQAAIQTREMPYRSADGTRMVGYFAYDDSKPGIRPGVIVVHEWWGLNDYAKRRARDLAELGYSALAIDMYGEGKHRAPAGRDGLHAGRDPGCRRRQGALPRRPGTAEAATADRSQPDRRDRLLLRRQDRPRHGPPGLPLAGVASFHGALGTATPASKGSVKAKILVEHGSADSLVPAKDLDALKQELNAAGADYRVVIQDGAKHGFTNPDADAHRATAWTSATTARPTDAPGQTCRRSSRTSSGRVEPCADA